MPKDMLSHLNVERYNYKCYKYKTELPREIRTSLRKIKGIENVCVAQVFFFCYYGYHKELPKEQIGLVYY